jgi:Uma2 family endonuclease
MASLLALSWPRLLTVEEFLQIDFGPELKAELEDGYIRMMAGGSRAHARVQMNLYRFLGSALRGSGCRPYGSDMGVRTKELALRYPDVSVDCGQPTDEPTDQVLGNPRVLIEVLSPSTRDYDLRTKKAEYREMASVDTIAFIDPEDETLSVSQRIAGGWTDSVFAAADLALPALRLVVPHAEIFAAD